MSLRQLLSLIHRRLISVKVLSPYMYHFTGVLLLLASVSTAQVQLLDYHKFDGYGLGKGILGNDYAEPLAACITGTEIPLHASRTTVRVSIVSSASEYKEALHIDQKAEFSFLGIGGGGEELHFSRETSKSSSAFDIIVAGYGERDSETIGHIKWDAPYDAMVASGDPAKIQQVRESCGDRYIQTVFYETRLFLVMHVSNTQESFLKRYRGSAHGKIDIDPVSASASLGGDANVSSARNAGAVDIEVITEGFGDIPKPTAAALKIARADGLGAIVEKVHEFLVGLHATGQPVKYRLAKLPLLPLGDLLNPKISHALSELKRNYVVNTARLDNIKSLLLPSDPRRILFKQPAADNSLRRQAEALAKYIDMVSEAHKSCRRALTFAICSTQMRMIPPVPFGASIELPPPIMPFLGPYFFAINGVPVPPGQNSVFLPNAGTTLLDQAKTLTPNASNVDLLAVITGGQYLSLLHFFVVEPHMPSQPPLVVASVRLLAHELTWPTYWEDKGAAQIGAVIHVLHADGQHPCKIVNSNGLGVIEESCLTRTGRFLRDIALANAAQHAMKQKPAIYDLPIIAAPTSCFESSPSGGLQVGMWHLVLTRKDNEFAVQVGLFVPVGPVAIPLVGQEERHDLTTWRDISKRRLRAATAWGNSSGPNPCSPHIP